MNGALTTLPAPARPRSTTVIDATFDVARARNQLLDGLDSMRQDLRRSIDWRVVARKHPVAVALAAAGLGLIVIHLLRRR